MSVLTEHNIKDKDSVLVSFYLVEGLLWIWFGIPKAFSAPEKKDPEEKDLMVALLLFMRTIAMYQK